MAAPTPQPRARWWTEHMHCPWGARVKLAATPPLMAHPREGARG